MIPSSSKASRASGGANHTVPISEAFTPSLDPFCEHNFDNLSAPKALRTHIIGLLGPKTIIYGAFGLS